MERITLKEENQDEEKAIYEEEGNASYGFAVRNL